MAADPFETKTSEAITLEELQQLIKRIFGEKDSSRGIDGTFMWLMEEIGELASALRADRTGDEEKHHELAMEFADVLAWLVTLANVAEVDLTAAVHEKYGTGCPRCDQLICRCDLRRKP
ncbi:MazG nucleotide pyrophosphohydrolase domain-containing protein [Calycomorphotria hydatis]|uniref:MazG nucleotide pyrophosphohydrolase domain protein n=1 Tax=Calycomorphotria hydatis TaxID=2528027 RepID=A0A517T7V5_9PLAN|nr:MazG nucleotide pyrophosphohydrolase domain-containing protein [Calycomorphotria hydatis]QDT64455.1 MazG nucleotide pyrophosphohydrolase domain protein [Calycomorphotria hydatis]